MNHRTTPSNPNARHKNRMTSRIEGLPLRVKPRLSSQLLCVIIVPAQQMEDEGHRELQGDPPFSE